MTLPPELVAALEKVTAKRARVVIDHILDHGHITTEELKETYGYGHPPRAARDVREEGIPLETFKVRGADGRSIAAYRFGDPSEIEHHKLGGRQVFGKSLKNALYASRHGRCAVCSQTYAARYLQIDHRIPYQVAGDHVADQTTPTAYMLICASCQRSKSWTCEHCENWKTVKDKDICSSCYWGHPESYTHIAMQPERREVVSWTGADVEGYETLQEKARQAGLTLPEYIKSLLEAD